MSKVIVITGGSAGIGAALGALLGRNGHRVVLAARNQEALDRAAAEAGANTVTVVADVTKRADVQKIKDEAIRACGHVDVWVNNAGRGINKKVLELTDDDIDQMIAVNLKSAIYGMQAIVPHFYERNAGHVVNVSSMLGRIPMATFRSVYSASKAALNTLTSNVRMDLRAAYPNIHVSLINVGPVSTGFFDNALGGTPKMPPGVIQFQTPEEVAAVIAGCIETPAPDVYTGPSMQKMVATYFEDVGAFEANVRGR